MRFIVATFPYAADFERDAINSGKDPESDTVKDPVNETQLKIIEQVKRNPSITIKLLAAELGINERNVKKNMKLLKDKGLIKRVGADRGGHWLAADE